MYSRIHFRKKYKQSLLEWYCSIALIACTAGVITLRYINLFWWLRHFNYYPLCSKTYQNSNTAWIYNLTYLYFSTDNKKCTPHLITGLHINLWTHLTIVLGNNPEVELQTVDVKSSIISYLPSAEDDRFQTSLLLKLHEGAWTSTDQLHSQRHHATNITEFTIW